MIRVVRGLKSFPNVRERSAYLINPDHPSFYPIKFLLGLPAHKNQAEGPTDSFITHPNLHRSPRESAAMALLFTNLITGGQLEKADLAGGEIVQNEDAEILTIPPERSNLGRGKYPPEEDAGMQSPPYSFVLVPKKGGGEGTIPDPLKTAIQDPEITFDFFNDGRAFICFSAETVSLEAESTEIWSKYKKYTDAISAGFGALPFMAVRTASNYRTGETQYFYNAYYLLWGSQHSSKMINDIATAVAVPTPPTQLVLSSIMRVLDRDGVEYWRHLLHRAFGAEDLVIYNLIP